MNRFLILVSRSRFRLVEAAWERVVSGGGVQRAPGWVLSVVIIQWRHCEEQATQLPTCDALQMYTYFYLKNTSFLYVTTCGPVGRSLLLFRRNPLHPSSERRIIRTWKRNDTVIGRARAGILSKPIGEVCLFTHDSGSISLFPFNTRHSLLFSYSFKTLVTINQTTRRLILIITALRTAKHTRQIPLSCVWEHLNNWVTAYIH